MQPLCFVLMPFGQKPDSSGSIIDFDAVYQQLIAPAIKEAELEPLRADEEQAGGIIHKPMFERLILCEYAVADLTGANANVFYELGVRHAVRPHTTILMFSAKTRLPFDVAPLRAIPYKTDSKGNPINVKQTIIILAERLEEAKQQMNLDSPIFQLVDGFPDIQRLKTDVFRDRIKYAEDIKNDLKRARKEGRDAVHTIELKLGKIEDQEAAVIVDLFLSYRAVKAWTDMIELVKKMPSPLANTVMIREQHALALNRADRGEEAERILLDLIEKRGPSSETYGILGRIYKDRWETAAKNNETILATALLEKAINSYLKGFESDWRDAYPGVNAVTLMELKDPPDPRRSQIIPVVQYAVERRISEGQPDYWDYATLLELAVLAKNEESASLALGNALTAIREVWEPETTVRNLRLIREVREKRNEMLPWTRQIEEKLHKSVNR